MMTNLFSSFDPSTNLMNFSLNWASSMIWIILLPSLYWFIPNRYYMIWFKTIFILHKEFKMLLGLWNYKGMTLIFISLFSFILFNNFVGLYPYIYTSSSHMSLTLTLALPLWFSFMIFGWLNNMQHMFSHLVPLGTPPIMIPFMICVETISNMIRPTTLAVRLMANMIAGHLLLTLLGNSGSFLNNSLVMILIFTQILLLLLEFGVSIVQSYVFAILSTLYSKEVI